MEGRKSFYAVSIWEYLYEKENARYTDLLMLKARRLKALESKNLFAIPEPEARQVQKQINLISEELNTLYGYKLFTDEMRNSYIQSIDSIYDAYHNRLLLLEMENGWKFRWV